MTGKVGPFCAIVRVFFLLTGMVFAAQAVRADCATPAGAAGDMTYSTSANVMVYCNGQYWVSMAGGVSLTVNTAGGGATPAGSSADVQFNSGGALAADTGNFTYSSGLLKAPYISTTAITASSLGTFGSLLVNGGATVSGQASITTISTTVISFAPSYTSIANLNGGSGNMIASGSAVVSTSSAGSITFYTGGAQRMLIGNDGSVQFGSSGLTPLVSVVGSGGSMFSVSATSGHAGVKLSAFSGQISYVDFFSGGLIKGNVYYDPSNDVFVINNQGRPTSINPNGAFVGIGTASPTVPLHLIGNINQMVAVFTNNGAGGAQGGLMINLPSMVSGNWLIGFNKGGTSVGTVTYNGTGVTYNTTSDRRVKENIADTREGLQKLMQIGVKDFSFKADPSHTVVNGFIAQDLNKVYPEAVTTNGDNGETPLKDKSKIWQVDYGRVTPLIVKAVQELNQKLEAANDNAQTMRSEIDQLRAELDKLKQANKK